ncbi:MAG: tetratricopeptide repeat protein, partial [Candidatus Latescibacterota bacterium]
ELMLLELYYDQGQLAQAEEAARRLIAGSGAQETVGGLRAGERAWQVLVSILSEQERHAEALDAAGEALRAYPDTPERAALELVAARSLFALEEYEQAEAAFARHRQAYPHSRERASVDYQLGVCREVLGDYAQAAAAFARLAQHSPDDPLVPDALFRAGENLYNDRQFAAALQTYARVHEGYAASPFAPRALYSAAWTLMDLEREEESIQAMQRLVQRYPDSEYARYAQFSVGDYYYGKERLALARAAYQQVMALAPASPEAEKARLLLRELEEDMASQEYQSAYAEMDRGNYERAAAGFDSVCVRFPRTEAALAALANKAVVLEKLGEAEQARAAYEQALRAAGERPGTQQVADFVRLRLESM